MVEAKKTVAPIATFFIGGAADKSKFWGIAPKTNLIKNQLIGRYLDAINKTEIGAREINNHSQKCYFGYDEEASILNKIFELKKTNPSVEIRLVGHSLGGWIAANLSEQITQAGMSNTLLITIDPVGVGYFNGYYTPILTMPRPDARIWINILAMYANGYKIDDLVADLGYRYRPSRDSSLKKKPQFDYGTPFSHAAALEMMMFPGAGGQSAWAYLTKGLP